MARGQAAADALIDVAVLHRAIDRLLEVDGSEPLTRVHVRKDGEDGEDGEFFLIPVEEAFELLYAARALEAVIPLLRVRLREGGG